MKPHNVYLVGEGKKLKRWNFLTTTFLPLRPCLLFSISEGVAVPFSRAGYISLSAFVLSVDLANREL